MDFWEFLGCIAYLCGVVLIGAACCAVIIIAIHMAGC